MSDWPQAAYIVDSLIRPITRKVLPPVQQKQTISMTGSLPHQTVTNEDVTKIGTVIFPKKTYSVELKGRTKLMGSNVHLHGIVISKQNYSESVSFDTIVNDPENFVSLTQNANTSFHDILMTFIPDTQVTYYVYAVSRYVNGTSFSDPVTPLVISQCDFVFDEINNDIIVDEHNNTLVSSEYDKSVLVGFVDVSPGDENYKRYLEVCLSAIVPSGVESNVVLSIVVTKKIFPDGSDAWTLLGVDDNAVPIDTAVYDMRHTRSTVHKMVMTPKTAGRYYIYLVTRTGSDFVICAKNTVTRYSKERAPISVIRSIQQGTIVVASGGSTTTVLINSVNIAKTQLSLFGNPLIEVAAFTHDKLVLKMGGSTGATGKVYWCLCEYE